MINRVVIIRQLLTRAVRSKFSSLADPYYILGVDKNADFLAIKKAFYKLANECHPDKASDNKKFLLIKQAYEAIKMQKGISKPAGFIYDTDTKSMRPDPSRFDTDDEQMRKTHADYRMYQEKAEEGGAEYEKFKGTFKTLNDINDIKIRVQKGEVKDTSTRFELDKLKVSIVNFSSNNVLILVLLVLGVWFINNRIKLKNKTEQRQLKEAIEGQQRSIDSRRLLDRKQVQKQAILAALKQDKDVAELLNTKKLSKNLRVKKQEVASGENSA